MFCALANDDCKKGKVPLFHREVVHFRSVHFDFKYRDLMGVDIYFCDPHSPSRCRDDQLNSPSIRLKTDRCLSRSAICHMPDLGHNGLIETELHRDANGQGPRSAAA